MKEFKITEEQIKLVARHEASHLMHQWYPEAFESELEEVSLLKVKDGRTGEYSLDIYVAQVNGKWETIVYVDNKNYFIREGKIWRKKA